MVEWKVRHKAFLEAEARGTNKRSNKLIFVFQRVIRTNCRFVRFLSSKSANKETNNEY